MRFQLFGLVLLFLLILGCVEWENAPQIEAKDVPVYVIDKYESVSSYLYIDHLDLLACEINGQMLYYLSAKRLNGTYIEYIYNVNGSLIYSEDEHGKSGT